ncbi:MAG: lipoate--protein ligase family protein [Candidatus Coatesbacteria bacterium]|nr:lipoate--protein ligase family protein [Candidatus Coatesbacteria bacterium]
MDRDTSAFRYIDSGQRSAAENMAVDEALFQCFDSEQETPTLRLYGWHRPCISLGYFQRAADAVRRDVCVEKGVDVVRRMTGGRAVLHDQEVTYCVVGSVRKGAFTGRLLECYEMIAECLVTGCERLGLQRDQIEVAAGKDARSAASSPACFMTSAPRELLLNGRKLIGSAQKRGEDVFLQHGSIPVRLDLALTASVMCIDEDDGTSPSERCLQPVSLERALGRSLTYDEVKSAISQGFSERLGLSIEPSELSEQESEVAFSLAQGKYCSDTWNFRR